jgi:hypothetical protein
LWNIPDVAAVSARALIRRRASSTDLVKAGTNTQVNTSRWRSSVSVWRRTSGASIVGAMFQVGLSFGSAFFVPNRRVIRSGGRKPA